MYRAGRARGPDCNVVNQSRNRPARTTAYYIFCMVHVGVLDCDVHKGFAPELGFQYYGDCVQAWLSETPDDWTCADTYVDYYASCEPERSPHALTALPFPKSWMWSSFYLIRWYLSQLCCQWSRHARVLTWGRRFPRSSASSLHVLC